jgi:hypothetical protein
MSSENSGSTDVCSISIAAQQELQQRQTQLQNDEDSRILPQSRISLPPLALPQQPPASEESDKFAEIFMNRTLYDPPRWGWTALGGIADVLSPHEVRYVVVVRFCCGDVCFRLSGVCFLGSC